MLLIVLGLAGAASAIAFAQSGSTATVEVRVWQRISDAQALYISARPEGGSWRMLGTIPVAMTSISDSGAYRYGDITVRVPRQGEDATVEVRVWQRVRDDLRLYISARPRGGSWSALGTIPLDMSGRSSTGTYRYGDISVDVPLPDTPTPLPEPTVTPTATPTPSGHTFTCSQLWDVHQSTPGPDEDTARTTVGYKVWDALCDSRNSQRLICADFRYQAARYSPRPTASGAHLYARWNERMLAKLGCPLTGSSDAPSYVAPAPGCDFADSAAKVVASTVLVTTSTSSGTAFYIGNGEFVTAGHVVEGVRSVMLRSAHINTTASVVGYFPSDRGDVAILRAQRVGLVPLEWASTLDVGETVAFAGYPHGFGTDAAISRGVISRFYTDDGISFIQTDAPINPGNSGGPLFDECGRVAGVASWKIVSGRDGTTAEGLGFAVADPSLNRLLTRIRSGNSPSYVAPRPTPTPQPAREDSYLTIRAFCTRMASEDRLSGEECDRRSSNLDTQHDYWQLRAIGVVDWSNVVYRFNDGERILEDRVWGALLSLGPGCHEIKVAEDGISTHWSAPYDFCFSARRAAPSPSSEVPLQSIDGRGTLLASDGTYLGVISSNRYQEESVCNEYGPHGSPYQQASVRNEYGSYGSPYGSGSAYNPYTSNPPRIFLNGMYIGYLTKNDFLTGAIDPDVLFAVYDCVY